MFCELKVTSHQGPDDLQNALEGCAAVVIPAGVPRKPGTQAVKQFSIEYCKTKITPSQYSHNDKFWATSLLSQIRQLYYALVAKEVVTESIDSRGREGG